MLEALKFNSRVIVVPNTSLMDNHQVELAQEFDSQGYVLRADTG
jgi:beta-1,4-N-acetylglucosaminyltransferase